MITNIISDIHLGSHTCQYDKLLEFLNNCQCDQLIINGDLFDSMNIRLKKDSWKILSKLRKMSNNIKIVWVKGNHDEPHPEILAELMGIELVNEYTFVDSNKKFIIVHGDRWDNFITQRPIITGIANWFYKTILQRLDKNQSIARFMKRQSKTFLRAKDKVKRGAIDYCKKLKCDVICCGHTHFYEKSIDENGVSYYNSGCWTEPNCGLIKIQNGQVA